MLNGIILLWFSMGLAAIAGGITAYPINSWLVKNKLKHGCMTIADKDAAIPNHQHDSVEHDHHPTKHTHQHADAQMAHHAHVIHHSHHSMATLPLQKSIGIIVLTFTGLLLAAWLTSVFLAPISFY